MFQGLELFLPNIGMAAFADQRGVRIDWLPEFKACARFHEKRLKMGKPLGKLMLLRNKLRTKMDR